MDASSFVEFEISEFEIERVDCIVVYLRTSCTVLALTHLIAKETYLRYTAVLLDLFKGSNCIIL